MSNYGETGMAMTSGHPPRVLIVAGSDPVAGAGLQADLKTVAALGGYAMTAVTAITVQDTRGVTALHPLPPELVASQMRACLEDVGADAVKIGILVTPAIVAAVAGVLADYPGLPVVMDPVLAATVGGALLEAAGLATLRQRLLPRVSLITPNLDECARLTGLTLAGEADWLAAARRLAGETGGGAVLIKGGHGRGERVVDLLWHHGEVHRFERPRRPMPPGGGWHGTGCTLASAVAMGLAQGLALPAAVAMAIDYIQQTMDHSLALGHGQRLLGHFPPGAG